MEKIVRVTDPVVCKTLNKIGCAKELAIDANFAFDESVKQFLRDWIEDNSGLSAAQNLNNETSLEEFIENGALYNFFKHTNKALECLLEQPAIAHHLLRPVTEVYFQGDAYEPLFAKFEQRIYNLALQREQAEIPFRYSPPSRHGVYGDTIGLAEMHPDHRREDIGVYFGTRRSDQTALTILARQLRSAVSPASSLPVHVITEGYMEDSLRMVKKMTERLQEDEVAEPHCFVIQRRHAADDRHLGAALLIMQPQQPGRPQRIIFCDTLNPSGIPPWWNSFKRKVDAVFPQPDGISPVSAILEDGGVKLQRLHDGVPVRHQDIDCAFYTTSMVRALIQIAQSKPDVILERPIEVVVSQMTARMSDYYAAANQPKEQEVVREVNVHCRWETGREALTNILLSRLTESPPHQPYVAELTLKF
ncbi:hypothetical protein [Spirosoma endbachense]|uniref:hypothetical protein n=1 Tax=Spirosoma endbachense TaxID=2666025 RepID=UPI0018E0AB43|nr:hypothetical protein [Spirosoma endbachense]